MSFADAQPALSTGAVDGGRENPSVGVRRGEDVDAQPEIPHPLGLCRRPADLRGRQGSAGSRGPPPTAKPCAGPPSRPARRTSCAGAQGRRRHRPAGILRQDRGAEALTVAVDSAPDQHKAFQAATRGVRHSGPTASAVTSMAAAEARSPGAQPAACRALRSVSTREPAPHPGVRSFSASSRALLALVMGLLCVITMASVVVRYFTSISFAFTEGDLGLASWVVMGAGRSPRPRSATAGTSRSPSSSSLHGPAARGSALPPLRPRRLRSHVRPHRHRCGARMAWDLTSATASPRPRSAHRSGSTARGCRRSRSASCCASSAMLRLRGCTRAPDNGRDPLRRTFASPSCWPACRSRSRSGLAGTAVDGARRPRHDVAADQRLHRHRQMPRCFPRSRSSCWPGSSSSARAWPGPSFVASPPASSASAAARPRDRRRAGRHDHWAAFLGLGPRRLSAAVGAVR